MSTDMEIFSIIFIVLSALLLLTVIILFVKYKKSRAENDELTTETEKLGSTNAGLTRERDELTRKYAPILDAERERERVLSELEGNKSNLISDISQLEENHRRTMQELFERRSRASTEILNLETKIEAMRQEIALLDETQNIQSFGFYKPRYGFESSSRYQIELERIRNQQKQMLSNKTAAVCNTQWSVNGSVVEGRKQINQSIKLILRAFNGEGDAAVAKVKYNNISVMQTRIYKAYEALNKLVTVQSIYLANDYLNLKLEELYLVHEYQEKIQEEKEEQRRIREEMREEEIARREIEKALADADREETRYAEALRKAREEVEVAVGQKQSKLQAQIELLQEKLAEAQANKERAISRAQQTRSGHVYVISNIGSFGEDIYKIGMTRRLDPMDRVRELGDASVPFRFDVHAIIYSEDAPTLENGLHRKFHNRRVNQVNHKREFFKVTLDEITKAVHEMHGEIEFTLLAEADEYRKTVAFLSQAQTIQ